MTEHILDLSLNYLQLVFEAAAAADEDDKSKNRRHGQGRTDSGTGKPFCLHIKLASCTTCGLAAAQAMPPSLPLPLGSQLGLALFLSLCGCSKVSSSSLSSLSVAQPRLGSCYFSLGFQSFDQAQILCANLESNGPARPA